MIVYVYWTSHGRGVVRCEGHDVLCTRNLLGE